MEPFDEGQAPMPALTTRPWYTRRAVITSAVTGVGGIIFASCAGLDRPPGRVPPESSENDELVPPLAAGLPDRTLFAPAEQHLASYLVSLAHIANGVAGPRSRNPGMFTGDWWRPSAKPFNARVSEQVLTLSWFLSAERDWNPYSRNAALRRRLTRAIDHYLTLQHQDGSWPEYAADQHSRAATAFALTYLSKTLEILRGGSELPEQCEAIEASLHLAVGWFLSPENSAVWPPDTSDEYSNQLLAGLAGCGRTLAVAPHLGLSRKLHKQVAWAAKRIQSPAGFLYEAGGMDVGYNFSVAAVQIADIHSVLRTEALQTNVARLTAWLSYVWVPEPDGSGLVAFTAASSRTALRYIDAVATQTHTRDAGALLGERSHQLHALYSAREDLDEGRARWARDGDPVPALAAEGDDPQTFVNLSIGEHYPDRSERLEAISFLPAVRQERFTKMLTDPNDQAYFFIRRKHYYAQAYFGTRPTPEVRGGLATLWHPRSGVFLHSIQDDRATWTTFLTNDDLAAKSRLTVSAFEGRGAKRRILSVADDIAGSVNLALQWSTDASDYHAEATFDESLLSYVVETDGPAVEQLPIVLRPSDTVAWLDGTGGVSTGGATGRATASGIQVRRGATTFRIFWRDQLDAQLDPTEHTYFKDASRRLHSLRVTFYGRIELRLSFTG